MATDGRDEEAEVASPGTDQPLSKVSRRTGQFEQQQGRDDFLPPGDGTWGGTKTGGMAPTMCRDDFAREEVIPSRHCTLCKPDQCRGFMILMHA